MHEKKSFIWCDMNYPRISMLRYIVEAIHGVSNVVTLTQLYNIIIPITIFLKCRRIKISVRILYVRRIKSNQIIYLPEWNARTQRLEHISMYSSLHLTADWLEPISFWAATRCLWSFNVISGVSTHVRRGYTAGSLPLVLCHSHRYIHRWIYIHGSQP